MTDEIMTAKQVAEYLKLNLMTVYRLAKAGKLSGSRIGRSWGFKREAVDRLLLTDERDSSIEPASHGRKRFLETVGYQGKLSLIRP